VEKSPEEAYYFGLRGSKSWHLITKGVLAVATCDDRGDLRPQKWAVINLNDGVQDRDRCSQIDCTNRGDNDTECIHVVACRRLYVPGAIEDPNSPADPPIVFLEERLFAALSTDGGYGVLKRTGSMIKCITCYKYVTSCGHVTSYQRHAEEYGCDPEIRKVVDDPHVIISKELIDYPFVDVADRKLFLSRSCGKKIPVQLIPPFDPSKRCTHGNSFRDGDPVGSEWVQTADAVLWNSVCGRECCVYYRPSQGECGCRQPYDGRCDHILNINNKHLVLYYPLINILVSSSVTRYPLKAAWDIMFQTMSAISSGAVMSYRILSQAYNAFIRLLNWNYSDLFRCSICGDDVECVVMDGVMMGSRKHLVPAFAPPPVATETIRECALEDRVYIRDASIRSRLAKYVGLVQGKYVRSPKPCTEAEYRRLLRSLEQRPRLQKVVEEAGSECPTCLRQLVGEVSVGSSTCGIYQIQGADFEHVRAVLGHVVTTRADLALVDRYCPMLSEAVRSKVVSNQSLLALVEDLLASVMRPFDGRVTTAPGPYPAPSEANDVLEFFPNHPLIRGSARYSADGKADTARSAAAKNDNELSGCRKETSRHKTLTPGLFTMFCPHGICLGFQIMSSPESPRTPFDILVRRFSVMPKLIVYDNACKLHLYVLKREPLRFQNTRFMVDRMHYKGHVGCSLGYCMDSYVEDKSIKEINSQVNEQANAALRRLTTQLTYMTSYNVKVHVKVFLGLRNMNKKAGVSTEEIDCAPSE